MRSKPNRPEFKRVAWQQKLPILVTDPDLVVTFPAAMAAVGAIGLAISTFTEHAIGAIAAVVVLIVASEVVDQIPQFAVVAPYLPTHWWNMFDSLLRTPVDTTTMWHGLLSFGVYATLFWLIAWARFTSGDVTS